MPFTKKYVGARGCVIKCTQELKCSYFSSWSYNLVIGAAFVGSPWPWEPGRVVWQAWKHPHTCGCLINSWIRALRYLPKVILKARMYYTSTDGITRMWVTNCLWLPAPALFALAIPFPRDCIKVARWALESRTRSARSVIGITKESLLNSPQVQKWPRLTVPQWRKRPAWPTPVSICA